MMITKGEFTRFSINGRMQLLHRYGKKILQQQHQQTSITIYKIFNYYVADIIITQHNHTVRTAEPVLDSIFQFYATDP